MKGRLQPCGVSMKKKKKKKSDLNFYANNASAQGITYGQKQAMEYAQKVLVGPVPKGYTKIGDRKKERTKT